MPPVSRKVSQKRPMRSPARARPSSSKTPSHASFFEAESFPIASFPPDTLDRDPVVPVVLTTQKELLVLPSPSESLVCELFFLTFMVLLFFASLSINWVGAMDQASSLWDYALYSYFDSPPPPPPPTFTFANPFTLVGFLQRVFDVRYL